MAAPDVLGVRPGAGRAEVNEAFRRYALRHHPDRGGDPARFQAGVDAYHELSGRRAPHLRADVVFHRRKRLAVVTVLRAAGRRWASVRPRP